MGSELRRALLPNSTKAALLLPEECRRELEEAAGDLDPINAHSLCELSLYMANMLLRDTDQMSMAHGLEVRESLLDWVLVEAVAGIPGPMKLEPGARSRTKGLLVDSLPVKLPGHVFRRPKMGFVFPWERWLRNELRRRVEATLLDTATLEASGLDSFQVRRLWTSYLQREPGVRYTDILCLHNLLYWVRQHGLALSADDWRPSTEACSASMSKA